MLSQSQKDSLERAVAKYEAHLDTVAPYLTGRGISKQTALTYRLGYVAEPARGDDEMVGRLAIPYLTTTGPVGIRYRSLDSSEPKYLGKAGAALRLFGVTALLKPSRSMYIVEGEIDCMTLNQIGLAAVGVPGANAWKRHWNLLFSDYDDVIVVGEGDKAGRDFARKVMEQIDWATPIYLPDETDINALLVSEGADELRKRMVA